jgi:hypothetical protein
MSSKPFTFSTIKSSFSKSKIWDQSSSLILPDTFQSNVVFYINGESIQDKTGRHSVSVNGSNTSLSNLYGTPMTYGRSTQGSIKLGATTSDYLEVSNSLSDFDWTSGSWTVEFWVLDPQTTPEKYWHLFVADGQSSRGTFKGYSTTGARQYGAYFYSSSGGGPGGNAVSVNYGPQRWHHVAISRVGSTGRIWLNGILRETSTFNPPGGTPSYARMGFWNTESAEVYFDEFRITRADKYGSSNFTPRTTPYLN